MSSVVGFFSNLLANTNEGDQYTVQKALNNLQIRNYQSWIVAQTVIKGDHQNSGNQAFHILAGYIFGGNQQKSKIQMTAPVNLQQVGNQQFAVEFVMPKQWTMNSLPKPNDQRVKLKTLPGRKVVALKYNGGWSEQLYQEQLKKLRNQMQKLGLKGKSEPIWARYNSPMAPAFLRTNQILIEI